MSEDSESTPSLAKEKIIRSPGLQCCVPDDLPQRIREMYCINFEEGSQVLFLPHSRLNAFKISGVIAELISRIPEQGELLGVLINKLANYQNLSRQELLKIVYPEVLKLISHGFLTTQKRLKYVSSIEFPHEVDEIPGWKVLRRLAANSESKSYEVVSPDKVAFLKVFSQEERRADNEIRMLRTIASNSGSSSLPELLTDGLIGSKRYYLASWIPGQSLQRVIEFVRRGADLYPLKSRLKICSSLIAAYKQLHAIAILHIDVHPDNVIVKNDFEVAICDFEFSCFFGEEVKGVFGVERFFSPAIARHALSQDFTSVKPTPQDELYSLVSLIFEVLTGAPMHPTPAESSKLLSAIAEKSAYTLEERGLPDFSCLSDVFRRATGHSLLNQLTTIEAFGDSFDRAVAADLDRLNSNLGRTRQSVLAHIALPDAGLNVADPESFNLMNGVAGVFLAQMVQARALNDISQIAIIRGSLEKTIALLGRESPESLKGVFDGCGGIFALAMRCDQILGETVVAPSLENVYGSPGGQKLGLFDGPAGLALALNPFWSSELRSYGIRYVLTVIDSSKSRDEIFWMAHGVLGSVFSLLTMLRDSSDLAPSVLSAVEDVLDLAADGIERRLSKIIQRSSSLDWSFCSGLAGALRVLTLAWAHSERFEELATKVAGAMRSYGSARDASLCCGNAGHALALWRYAAQASDHDYKRVASCRLVEAGKTGTKEHINTSFYFGGLGVEALSLAFNSAEPSKFDEILWLM